MPLKQLAPLDPITSPPISSYPNFPTTPSPQPIPQTRTIEHRINYLIQMDIIAHEKALEKAEELRVLTSISCGHANRSTLWELAKTYEKISESYIILADSYLQLALLEAQSATVRIGE